jgi:hypothetical protein
MLEPCRQQQEKEDTSSEDMRAEHIREMEGGGERERYAQSYGLDCPNDAVCLQSQGAKYITLDHIQQ